ncbi:MAG: glucose 1-dehydrogenase [Aigarchaeota archaeon]|nr:glucose 1-dehydrogenase [Aigarchaeota archaeon]MCX8193223.1 glucose 1-dehydrogenase [Nitrososphaeria archaeon]MDW7986364.1 glucose 1-dehydrogenase [Nitrososphaerota archaeon]
MERLKDKVAVITGAARGIGRATALLFAREGAKVVIVDILEKEGKETCDQINKNIGEDRALFIRADVSEVDDVKDMSDVIVRKYGRIDILVNNAAIQPIGTILDTDIATWDKVMKINLRSAFLCCKFIIPHMIKNRSGSIVNVASILGLRGGDKIIAYATSKAGLIGFTKALAEDLMPYNIRVNAVAPRAIDTEMFRAYRSEEELKKKMERYLFGRLGRPEEVAQAILFLASEESSYITGEVLVIGGYC